MVYQLARAGPKISMSVKYLLNCIKLTFHTFKLRTEITVMRRKVIN